MNRGPTATTLTTSDGGEAMRKDTPRAVHPSMATPTGSSGSSMASKPIRIKSTAATIATEQVFIQHRTIYIWSKPGEVTVQSLM